MDRLLSMLRPRGCCMAMTLRQRGGMLSSPKGLDYVRFTSKTDGSRIRLVMQYGIAASSSMDAMDAMDVWGNGLPPFHPTRHSDRSMLPWHFINSALPQFSHKRAEAVASEVNTLLSVADHERPLPLMPEQ